MKLIFLSIGVQKRDAWAELQNDYEDKISRLISSFQLQFLRSVRLERDEAANKRRIESKKLLEHIQPNDELWLFDERGQSWSSERFSDELSKRLEGRENIVQAGQRLRTGTRDERRLVLLVGGAFGVTEEVFKRANVILSLSDMVFHHQLAQLVVFEQIYRGLMIWKNISYHNNDNNIDVKNVLGLSQGSKRRKFR